MESKHIHKIFAFIAFCTASITYILTAQTSIPFWDCGEFTSAAIWQQVPHPPGAPLFLIIAKLFDFLPFTDPAWRINLVSVLSSSCTILLVYLSIEILLKECSKSLKDIYRYTIALCGSLCFVFSDTFWFNAVESEVYAMSTLIVSLIVYLILRWRDQPHQSSDTTYLVLISYLIGLSIGVHLFSILTLFTVMMLIYFKKYEFSWLGFAKMTLLSIGIFSYVYIVLIKTLPSLLAGNFLVSDNGNYVFQESSFIVLCGLIVVFIPCIILYIAHKKGQSLIKLIALCILLIMAGFTTYTHTFLRSSAHPPMNENAPNTMSKLASYINREQYGDAPMWPRRYKTGTEFEEMHKKYGNWYSPSYIKIDMGDGTSKSKPDYSTMKINLLGEIKYMFNYQIGHMYMRYFLWNFMGKAGDLQDSPAFLYSSPKKEVEIWNYLSDFKDIFPIQLFALPFIMGIIGLLYHIKNAPKTAYSFIILFIMLGVFAAIAQNQQEPQPRERDYFYVGSFMVWCMWIALGFQSIIYIIVTKVRLTVLHWCSIMFLFFIPGLMAKEGWFIHDRSKNSLAFDMSYNMLQSCEKDAILFTNGDNDTFPLWYLQDVEGIRRDIRIVNLSLAQMGWYLSQLKHDSPWGAKPIQLTFSDASLDAPENSQDSPKPILSEARSITIPIEQSRISSYFIIPDNAIQTMSFTYTASPAGEQNGKPLYVFGVEHQVIADILQNSAFTRPVYFSMTVSKNYYSGLESYVRQEGMALRVCPLKQSEDQTEAFYEPIMDACFLHPINGNQIQKQQAYGYIFRDLADNSHYYDEFSRNYLRNYRLSSIRYADYLIKVGQTKKAGIVLNAMNTHISPIHFPMNYLFYLQIADLYRKAGYTKEMSYFSLLGAQYADALIMNKNLAAQDPYAKDFSPYVAAAEGYQYSGRIDIAIERLRTFLPETNNDPYLQNKIDELELLVLENKKQYSEALILAETFLKRYMDPSNKRLLVLVPRMEQKVNEIRVILGLTPLESMTRILN